MKQIKDNLKTCYIERMTMSYNVILYITVYYCILLYITVYYCILLYITVYYCILLYITVKCGLIRSDHAFPKMFNMDHIVIQG